MQNETSETIWVKNLAADMLIKENETAVDKINILPLAEAMLHNAHIRNMEYIELFGNISAVYLTNGEYKRALDILDSHLNSEYSQERSIIYTAKGNVCLLEGRFDDSIDCIHQALEIQKHVSEKDHSATMTIYNNIGLIYHKWGRCEDALATYHQVQEIAERRWGEKHPNTTSVYRNIGNVYRTKRKYRDALKWYKKLPKYGKKFMARIIVVRESYIMTSE